MNQIAVVEDSTNTSELVRRYLDEIDLNDVVVFERGESFLDWIRDIEVERDLDLVLLDWVLPGVNGLGLLRELNERYDLTRLPVLMVTSKTRPEELKQAFEARCMDYVKKPINKVELQVRVESALRLKQVQDRQRRQLDELREARNKLEEANQELERLSREDGLTGLNNKREFTRIIRQEWKRARREEKPLGLIIIDVDRFKAYNDTYGHEAGDRVLKAIGEVIDRHARRPGDCAARFGGEEFAVLLPDTEENDASSVAEQIRSEIENLDTTHEGNQPDVVTVSAGVRSLVPEEGSDHETLIRQADRAMYRAKENGRNRIAVASAS